VKPGPGLCGEIYFAGFSSSSRRDGEGDDDADAEGAGALVMGGSPGGRVLTLRILRMTGGGVGTGR